jgi:hypothetical protein
MLDPVLVCIATCCKSWQNQTKSLEGSGGRVKGKYDSRFQGRKPVAQPDILFTLLISFPPVPLSTPLYYTMSAILNLLNKVSPAPYTPSHQYDGFELRWKAFVFRPALFQFEALMLGVLGAYVALYFLGKAFNESRAKRT